MVMAMTIAPEGARPSLALVAVAHVVPLQEAADGEVAPGHLRDDRAHEALAVDVGPEVPGRHRAVLLVVLEAHLPGREGALELLEAPALAGAEGLPGAVVQGQGAVEALAPQPAQRVAVGDVVAGAAVPRHEVPPQGDVVVVPRHRPAVRLQVLLLGVPDLGPHVAALQGP